MPSGSNPTWRRWFLCVGTGSATILIVVCAIAWRLLGSPEAARAFLRGEDLAVIPATVDLGECAAGDEKTVQFRVVNLSSSPITLTGVYTSCSCIAVSSLPTTVEARGSFPLQMTVHSSEAPGRFTRSAVLYSDSKVSPQLPIELRGRTLDGANRLSSAGKSESPEETPKPDVVRQSTREPDLALEKASK